MGPNVRLLSPLAGQSTETEWHLPEADSASASQKATLMGLHCELTAGAELSLRRLFAPGPLAPRGDIPFHLWK